MLPVGDHGVVSGCWVEIGIGWGNLGLGIRVAVLVRGEASLARTEIFIAFYSRQGMCDVLCTSNKHVNRYVLSNKGIGNGIDFELISRPNLSGKEIHRAIPHPRSSWKTIINEIGLAVTVTLRSDLPGCPGSKEIGGDRRGIGVLVCHQDEDLFGVEAGVEAEAQVGGIGLVQYPQETFQAGFKSSCNGNSEVTDQR